MDKNTDTSNTAAVAQALLQARRDRRPTPAAALAHALRTPEEAYQVQRLVREALEPGESPMAWKSGGPSRTATLTHAPLPGTGVWPSPAKAGAQHFNFRLIEAEVALRLAEDVTAERAAGLTHETAARLVGSMGVSIEIVDSRWSEGVDAPPLLKLADLQCHGALVVGEARSFEPLDWARQECVVQIGSAPPQRFRGTHSLGDPAWLLPTWLQHATRGGEVVKAGTLVTTGTWCGMLEAAAGDRVHVTFDNIGEASVQL